MWLPCIAPFRQRRVEKVTIALPVPIEVQHVILDHLSQPTVLALSAVSRAWRRTATSHAHYYLYVPLYRCVQQANRRWPKPAPPLAVACAALERAARAGTRVAIEASFLRKHKSSILPWKQVSDARLLEDMVNSIRAVLGSTILLDITCSYDWHASGDRLDEALSAAAPLLRRMALRFIGDLPPSAPRTLSPDIFAGHAPRLHMVELQSMPLPSQPVRAFHSVSSVLESGPHIGTGGSLSTHFPNASAVELVLAAPPQTMECLDGLNLQRLRIAYARMDWWETKVEWTLPEVQDVEIVGLRPMNLVSYLSTISSSCPSTLTVLCLCLPLLGVDDDDGQRDYKYSITVQNATRHLRLEFITFSSMGPQLALVLPTISVLELNQGAASNLFADGVDLPVLEALSIIVNSRAASSCAPNAVLNCPQLREVVIIGSDEAIGYITEEQEKVIASYIKGLGNSLELGYDQAGCARRCTLRFERIIWVSPLETYDLLHEKFDRVITEFS